jgi:polyisoprenoid-binding protein YceI
MHFLQPRRRRAQALPPRRNDARGPRGEGHGTPRAGSIGMHTREEATRFVPRETPKRTKDGDLERWEINPAGSRLTFVLRHLVVQQIHGRFGRWGGTLFLDRQQPWLSSVRVWIDLASIDTDSAERDEHIRSPELMDVAQYPRADFESTSIEPRDGALQLRGRLDLHGVIHDVELEVVARPGATSAGRSVYGVSGKLNRQSFGLRWNQDLDIGGVVVGDEVELAAEVEVIRAMDDVGPPA